MHSTYVFKYARMIVFVDECGCCEPNTDYSGHDINANPHDKDHGAHVDSAVSCQLLCQTRPACRFFTFIQDTGECWLKTSDWGRRQKENVISGKKYCGNYSLTIWRNFGILQYAHKDYIYCLIFHHSKQMLQVFEGGNWRTCIRWMERCRGTFQIH